MSLHNFRRKKNRCVSTNNKRFSNDLIRKNFIHHAQQNHAAKPAKEKKTNVRFSRVNFQLIENVDLLDLYIRETAAFSDSEYSIAVYLFVQVESTLNGRFSSAEYELWGFGVCWNIFPFLAIFVVCTHAHTLISDRANLSMNSFEWMFHRSNTLVEHWNNGEMSKRGISILAKRR